MMNKKTLIKLVRVALAAVMIATTLSLLPEAVQPVEASPNYSDIRCGTSVIGRITTSDYYDYWYFNGKAGDQVTIKMTSTSGNLDSMVRLWLWNPSDRSYDFVTLDGKVGGNSSAVISNYTLLKTGYYRINPRRSGGRDGITTGSYRLTLECSSGSPRDNASNSCPQFGSDILWKGMLKVNDNNPKSISTNDGDFWAFRANSGDRVDLLLITSDFVPDLRLFQYETSLKQIAQGIKTPPPTPDPEATPYIVPSYSIKDLSLKKSGCYYVWVRASSNSQPEFGDYALLLNIK